MKSLYARAKSIKRPEQILQIEIFKALTEEMEATGYKNWMAWHYPGGGYRTEAEGKIFKAMGTMPGFADIGVMIAGGRLVLIELKCKTVKPSGKIEVTKQNDNQLLFEARMRALGFEYCVVAATDSRDGLSQILEIIRRNGGKVL